MSRHTDPGTFGLLYGTGGPSKEATMSVFNRRKQQDCPACTKTPRQAARQTDPRASCANCKGSGRPRPAEPFRLSPMDVELVTEQRAELARDRGWLSRTVTVDDTPTFESVKVLADE